MPKVAVVIPARWGSTRFPGKPLIQHVWERCQRAKGVEGVVIATDDMRIAEASFDFGAEVSMTSPKHRSGTDRVAEVAGRLKGITHVVNVQGDEPVIEPKLVSRLATALLEDKRIDMVTAANEFGPEEDVANPNAVKVVLDRDRNGIYFSRSPIPFVRDSPVVPYYRHQGIYGYSTKFLLQFVKWKPGLLERSEQLEQLRALENGARIRVILTKHASIGVDTPEDVATVERLLA